MRPTRIPFHFAFSHGISRGIDVGFDGRAAAPVDEQQRVPTISPFHPFTISPYSDKQHQNKNEWPAHLIPIPYFNYLRPPNEVQTHPVKTER
jgi:hypothetical protein